MPKCLSWWVSLETDRSMNPTEQATRELFDILQYDVLEYSPQEVLVQSRADGTTSLKVFVGDGWETSDSDAWRVS